MGEIVASRPSVLEEADDPPRNPPAPGARIASTDDIKRDRAVFLLRRVANYRTAAALATFATKGFDASLNLGPAEVYAAAARRELFDAIASSDGKKRAVQRVSPLLQRCAKASTEVASKELGSLSLIHI